MELMIAMSIGLIVLGAATSLFKTGMSATFVVSQRAETQQNMRAAIDMMNKDISLAGAGITGGIPDLVLCALPVPGEEAFEDAQ